MASWIGGCRFKIEEVDNGWIIEFHPRKVDETSSKTQKHIAQLDYSNFHLLEVLRSLLEEQDQPDQEEEPTASEQSPE